MQIRAIYSTCIACMSALLLCAGCSSGSGDPPAAPAGLTATHEASAIRLVWNPAPPSDVDSYEVEGRVTTSAFEIVDVVEGDSTALVASDPTLPDATPLSFRVRAVKEGKRSAYSNEVSIASLKPFLLDSALPESGIRVVLDAFAADFAFNAGIDPASANPASMTFLDSSGKALPTTVTLGSDGRSVHLVLGLPFTSAGQVSASVRAHSRSGQDAVVSAGPWFAPSAAVFQNQQLQIFPTNGVIRIALPDPISLVQPPSAVLFAGSLRIAELGPPPWGPVAWDTRTVPEGQYPISIRIPGFADNPTWTQGPQVLVDRTPAHVTCVPDSGQPDQVGVTESIRVLSDEDLFDMTPVLLVDGVARPTRTFQKGFLETDLSWDFNNTTVPTAPFVESVSLGPAARDDAGNPVIVSGCTFQVRPWLERWGPTLTSPDGPVLASSLAIDPGAPALNGVFVGWVPPSGAPGEGRLFAATFSSAAVAAPVALSSPGAVVSSVSLAQSLLGWTESVGSGPRAVMAARFQAGAWTVDPASPLNFDRTRDAAHVSVAQTESLGTTAGRSLVWSEDDGNGGRVLRGSESTFSGWVSLPMDVGATPGGIADFPEFNANFPAIGPFSNAFVTFLDGPPGGIPQVRTSNGNIGSVAKFSPGPGPLNADPSSAASDPSGFAFGGAVVAWVEGGKVFARTADFGGIFSSPTVLNSDPARAARSPRVTNRGVVFFVEAGPQGDEIHAKRWDAGAWSDLGVLNPGATGAVAALAVAPGPFVAWADGGGAVHLVQGNF